jgi:cytochrome c-type biogenesis protein CcmE
MQMLYNSDNFAVVQFDLPGGASAAKRGGFEIVDKFARKEIYIQGALADSFRRGVEALVEAGPTEEELDDFISGFTLLAQHPLVLH